MRKVVGMIACIFVFAFILTGCSGFTSSSGSSGDGDKITLKFMHRWPKEPEKSYLDKVVKEFEKKNPNIKIQTEAVLNDSYKEKIRVLLGTNHPPDIFFSWSGEFAHNIVRGNKALDLTSYYNKDKTWSDKIIEPTMESYRFDGKMYGVPWMMDAKLFFYNKDIFNKLGLKPPKTFKQLIAVSKKLKDKGYTPIAFGNKEGWPAGHYIGTLNRRTVPADVIKKDHIRSQGTFDDPGYIKALEKLQKLNDVAFNKNSNALKYDFSRQAFTSGKAAMDYMETIEIGDLPDIGFELGTFNFPAVEDGKGDQKIISGAPEGFMISSKTKHPDAAMKFLEFLTNKENGKKLVKDVKYLSSVKNTVTKDNSTPIMRKAQQEILHANKLAPWIDTGLDIRIADAYMKDMQKMLNGEMAPKDVMKDVQKEAKRVRVSAK
ncbi:carbohydrate ABC transporter substrate-binding protein (CUT1 family) [Scopulibacillus darangshiensis]|uniref:Carbohydrate ABC transporter substrate-binding protein (CUT1 family) n=1 Tax=Scopulibacillus darangshiensis TaxID=442528 RepID=A0A4R2NHY5_9BACL|nr:extracellular solute-binding protein [Scopulibacillus darangshiensis]TCP20774.1 carbohydrate ABC transporter substrate-binding protein (CUT1 family) [Scopulibacillus darangshiensis]